MDASKYGLSSNSDLFILVAPRNSRQRADKPPQTDTTSSAIPQNTPENTSTATSTSNGAATAQIDRHPRRAHRYTITANADASVDVDGQPGSKKTEQSQNPASGGAHSGEGVTASLSHGDNSPSETIEDSSVTPPSALVARADGRSGSTVESILPSNSIPTCSQGRTESPMRQNMGRPRYPPSSYRGPSTAVMDETHPTMKPTRSIPPPLNKEAIDHLAFGRLTLDQRSRAIDAPPSPHKPSGISQLVRRLSGKRPRTDGPRNSVPSKPFPPTPAKSAPAASQVDRTDSYSSIATAPAPYTSPDQSPSPQKHLKSRRRTLATTNLKRAKSTSSNTLTTSTPASPHSHSPSASTNTTTALPDPEVAYAETHYFSACQHTSPPSHRPLNVHPIPTRFTATTLKYPPLILRARLAISKHPDTTTPLPTIIVIPGTCAECDYRARRQQEGEILAKYADIRNTHLARIWSLRVRITSSSTSTAADDEGVSSADESDGNGDTLPRRKSDVMDSEEAQDLELEILSVESEIEDLTERQDGEVKRVWRGWAAKWGPGTIGIHRSAFNYFDDDDDDDDDDMTTGGEGFGSESTLSGNYTGSGGGSGSGSAARLMRSASGSGTSGKLKRNASSASTCRGGLNRWSGPVDDVVAEGRMKLDWIRPDVPKDKDGNRTRSEN